jgi:hypothetical protein
VSSAGPGDALRESLAGIIIMVALEGEKEEKEKKDWGVVRRLHLGAAWSMG